MVDYFSSESTNGYDISTVDERMLNAFAKYIFKKNLKDEIETDYVRLHIEALLSITEKYSSIKFTNLDSLHADGRVFLKGNQKTGNVFIRSENGLGEGILLTCQYDHESKESCTFGPLPLNFFHN